ncbi:MAG: dihydroorotate dehydrogenase [Candidatus Omnitrophica bacterium CG12_big_fil_rev_8_21_14_0_65_43_15]|uniref:Dihydroorotate dehydrogenase n=1 Tax=Candidatus Taenaricola geysiri TaxID=1974752 RepID=A0A2J0LFS6_9BACT|nr:MAG: dihydroorotate dehydrogenase B catalytic subunit [Candidatus Omnitrophica bacterium CG1_02_43_210]PIV12320.1 MAG: dihydroorotate dehydrogenase [Candidatus Omnitrophica bacterium CG03_land_8_20_14_0_80_43_22]PIW66701.1 MAG: dihydroorotate dehydrogenase [Candidatus Omnitrophica bacterium CG12_big_fil_rev_8_21_14_0_65_43_15]PIW79964.1 MAG: dihydroorotate dehydrogenase [Candidatus Omnitrophica bacterium CG_4_8_14_3_um_filter_43_15]PIY83864.1 MAG: dihydroorotate dehydrogenase [Candidatus Omn
MGIDLNVKIGKLKLKNPVMVASGTFGYAEEFKDFFDVKNLGAIVTKTITLNPRPGNPMPRTCETAAGMLNSIGLENPGLDVFIKENLPKLKDIGVPIVVSIASEKNPAEFIELASRLDKIDEVCALELNISCPNLKNKLISQDARATYSVVNAVRKMMDKTIITKLSPNVTDITEIAKVAQDAGSDAISLVNTFLGMAIDADTKKSKLANITGGLSGPAIKPIALRMVYEAASAVKIPVIGIGGIITALDAIEFIIAGAQAVQVGTANFINPRSAQDIIDGLTKYLKENKINRLEDLKGSLKI